MEGPDLLILALGGGAIMGSLLALRTVGVSYLTRDLTELPSEMERLKKLLANTSTIELLDKVYLESGQYKTADGKNIDASVVAHQVLEIDSARSLRDKNYLKNLFEHLQENAQHIGARYFSLSEPVSITRYLTYSLALLRERRN